MYNKEIKTTYLNGAELKTAFENIGKQVEVINNSVKDKCSQCDANGAVRTEQDGWLCSEHYGKLSEQGW